MKKGYKRGGFIALCIGAFIVSCIGSAIVKVSVKPEWSKKYDVEWDDSVGTLKSDISYGDKESNKFDLYLPADDKKENYGLVVYLHAGGFTSGDKTDDKSTLAWLCSKGYVSVGIKDNRISCFNGFQELLKNFSAVCFCAGINFLFYSRLWKRFLNISYLSINVLLIC